MEVLSSSHKQFARLLEVAGLDKVAPPLLAAQEVAEGHFTILAPVDGAFQQLGAEVSRQLFAEKEVAEQVARAHLLPGSFCCSSVPRVAHSPACPLHCPPSLQASRLRQRSHLGSHVTLRRARGGWVMADTAEVIRCPQAATMCRISRCDLAAGSSLIHSLSTMVGGRSRRGWIL